MLKHDIQGQIRLFQGTYPPPTPGRPEGVRGSEGSGEVGVWPGGVRIWPSGSGRGGQIWPLRIWPGSD